MHLKIIITGPESTGKSTLARLLKDEFSGILILEYAREYIEKLNRPYAYFDLVNIANQQIAQFREFDNYKQKILFFDTGPEITKIWFDEVYGSCPEFLKDFIKKLNIDLFLLCKPDIKWVKDKTRENNGIKRQDLFKQYKNIFDENKFKYKIISEFGQKRLKNAVKAVSSAYDLQNL